MATLGDYITDTRRLLHDAIGSYWSDPDLTAFINRAVQQRDRDTGMNRALVTGINLTPNQPLYQFTAIHPRALDVLGIVLIWGNYRYQLEEASYTDLGSLFQPWQGYQNVPVAFSKYGVGSVRFAPIPGQVFPTEWDLIVYAADLATPGDSDPLPYPWTDPVPFLASHFAKIELQQWDEAGQFMQLYRTRLTDVMNGARGRMLQRPYYGAAGRRW